MVSSVCLKFVREENIVEAVEFKAKIKSKIGKQRIVNLTLAVTNLFENGSAIIGRHHFPSGYQCFRYVSQKRWSR